MDQVTWHEQPELRRPAALIAFEGWGDAGEASSGAVAHLVAELGSPEPFANIDPEGFFDFVFNRPLVELQEGGSRRLRWPRLELSAYRLKDQNRDLVAVLGDEPNYRWRTFCRQLIGVLRELGVKEVVTMGAFIGQVAHTLPVPLIGVARDHEAVRNLGLLPSSYQGPTGIVGVLNHLLLEEGFEAVSVWAAVPHYIANHSNPPAMLALLEKACEIVGAEIPTERLRGAAEAFRTKVDGAVAESDELGAMVQELEASADPDLTGAGDPGIRLVEEIERYLRGS
ncbi:MAG: PAC2 family protein [Acidimicrobiia bacterium]